MTALAGVGEPQPGAMTAQATTSPYHLVLAERSVFVPRSELTFIFLDQDHNLISRLSCEVWPRGPGRAAVHGVTTAAFAP